MKLIRRKALALFAGLAAAAALPAGNAAEAIPACGLGTGSLFTVDVADPFLPEHGVVAPRWFGPDAALVSDDAAADPERAPKMQAYMKSAMPFLGVPDGRHQAEPHGRDDRNPDGCCGQHQCLAIHTPLQCEKYVLDSYGAQVTATQSFVVSEATAPNYPAGAGRTSICVAIVTAVKWVGFISCIDVAPWHRHLSV
mgnify:CR=1 FL=1